MADLDSPLSADDIKGINQALADARKAQNVLAKLKAAGEDTSTQETQLREMVDKLTRLKGQFSPGR